MYATKDPTLSVQIERVAPFGLLVSLTAGRAGIIREREIAWEPDGRRHWREHFKPGETLRAVPLGEDYQHRLELSLRLAQYDPWVELPIRYHIGQVVKGIVTGIQPYGVFVEIEPGVTGLLHHDYLPSWGRAGQQDDLFWLGDQVKAAIDLMDPAHRRIKLSSGACLVATLGSKHAPPTSDSPPVYSIAPFAGSHQRLSAGPPGGVAAGATGADRPRRRG